MVLTLDGYNNTAALSDNASLPDTPLPTWVNQPFLDCLNQTIGAAVPLVDNDFSGTAVNGGHSLARTYLDTPGVGLFTLLWIVLFCHLVK